uniref:Tyrosine-protein phosphatase domain-containing protein n=1 Tax=Setaria digitata TaxID=48799 RepID=A0A915PZF5_9BILA
MSSAATITCPVRKNAWIDKVFLTASQFEHRGPLKIENEKVDLEQVNEEEASRTAEKHFTFAEQHEKNIEICKLVENKRIKMGGLCGMSHIFRYMVDTIQTKEGAVAISAENLRSSMRSMRRGKTKNILTPASLASHVSFIFESIRSLDISDLDQETSLLRANGRKLGEGVADLYEQFEKESPTFFAFFNSENRAKNKFPDEIFLFDRTRVVLNDKPDYYHASYVDGCKQAKQYILAQAPFNEATANDFFRLVMQCKPEVIIVLMDLDKNGNEQYIMPTSLKVKKYGSISVRNEKQEKRGSSKESTEKYGHYKLILTKEMEKETKIEQKYQLLTFNSWTDDMIIPADDFVKFYKMVHKQLDEKPRECSQLVVCPTGAHRAGIWAVFDTEAERLKTKNRIRFSDTVNYRFISLISLVKEFLIVALSRLEVYAINGAIQSNVLNYSMVS